MNDQSENPKSVLHRGIEFIAVFLSSCFFTSYLPAKFVSTFRLKWGDKSLTEEKWTGAGLIGSLWGLLTYLLLPEEIAASGLIVTIAVATAIILSHIAERSMRSHDDPRIVIDEWIGTWIALWSLPQHLVPEVILAFILFRVLDVVKGPWGHALQRLPGGFGVTLDDVLAGILANWLTRGYLYVHGMM
jgi:phosphatidylglycerophosphatase A